MMKQLHSDNTRTFEGSDLSGSEQEESTKLTKRDAQAVVRDSRMRLKRFVSNQLSSVQKVESLKKSQIDVGTCLGQGSFSSVYEIRSINGKRLKKIKDDSNLALKLIRPRLAQSPKQLARAVADLAKEGLF